MGRRLVWAAVALALASTVSTAWLAPGGPTPALARESVSTAGPPMGWNGFNRFGRSVTAAIVEGEASAIVSSGMKAAGYEYVNLDGGWDILHRDAQGNLQPDPAKFPGGIKPVADYVHSLGLKLGIYTDAGYTNCAGTSAGSYGHDQQDADSFAAWTVDYVKMDWCFVPYQDFPGMTEQQVDQLLAARMRDALANTGRQIVYSITLWGKGQNWTWASSVANLWRTTGDINDSYTRMVQIFDANALLYRYARSGAWNDPDMLEVGNGGMTDTEYRSHFSLWAEMAAPLLAGADLRAMSAATRDTYTNAEVIAVDQDPLSEQGHPVQSAGGHWVLSKPLVDGTQAVVLFNQTDVPAVITTTAQQLELPAAPGYLLRDLWQHTTSESGSLISASVAPHAVVMYRIAPARPRCQGFRSPCVLAFLANDMAVPPIPDASPSAGTAVSRPARTGGPAAA